MSLHQEPSFVTQPSIKITQPIIIDEELDYLKTLSKNAYNEYFETITLLNHKKNPEKNNEKSSENPLNSHLFRSEKSFFNNDSKIQEIRRGRFIGKLLHGISYNNNLENYQQIITDKIKKISVSNLLPEDMSRKMSKTLEKRIEKLHVLLSNFEQNLEKIGENPDEISNKSPCFSLINAEIIQQSSLLNNLKTAVFFNNKTEENENIPHVSLGISSDLIYDKIPKKPHENFTFLTEIHLKTYINELHKEKFCLKKLKKLSKMLEYLPQMIFFRLSQQKSSVLSPEINELIPSYPFKYPQKHHEILTHCKLLIQGFSFNFELNFDNPTMLFYNIDNFFQENFEKQGFFLNFSEYIIKPNPCKNTDNLLQDGDIFMGNSQISSIKLKKAFWIEDLPYLLEIDKTQRQQRIVLEEFINNRLFNWLKYLTMNNLEQIQMRINRLIRDLKEVFLIKNGFDDIFFDFLQGYFKLLVIKSRNSIGKLISYLNFFRMVQKNITNIIKKQINKQENVVNPEKNMEKLRIEDEEKHYIEKNLNKLFEKQNKFEKYVLSSPVRPHNGLLNIYQNTEKFNKNLNKIDDISYEKAAFSEEPRDEFFRGLDDNYSLNNDDYVIIEDFNKEKIIYDASLHDFFDLSEEIVKICAFYMHLTEKEKKGKNPHVIFKEEKNPLEKDDFYQQDEETLFNEILELECRFHLEKVKLVMKYLEILKNCLVLKERQGIMRQISQISGKRPSFDLTKNTILESYQLEIRNIVLFNEMLNEIITNQKNEENEVFLMNSKYEAQQEKINEFNTKNKPFIPEKTTFPNENNVIIKEEDPFSPINTPNILKIHRISENNDEKPEENNDFFYLNDYPLEEKPDFFTKLIKISGKSLYFFFDKIVKFLENLHDSQQILHRLLDSSDTTDTIERLVINNLFFQQIFFFWSKLLYNLTIFEDLFDYKFLENDPILDKAMGYEIFKREFFKEYYERADRPIIRDFHENSRNPSENWKKSRISNNSIQIHRVEFLELMFNYIELIRLRDLINIHLFIIAFLIEIYKEQLQLFYDTPIYLFQAIGVNSITNSFNIFKYFISLDKLRCSSEIIDLQNWIFYMITPKRMLEPALLLNTILCLEVLANIGITINNLYICELGNEFKDDILKKKYRGSSHIFFYNIFEKKKRQVYLAATLNIVVTKKLERIREKLKNKKNLKETLTKMNKIDLTEKKPKKNLGILEMFCTILQKELAFDLMKIQTIIIRNQLISFDKKLPFPKRLFEISRLTSPDYQENTTLDHDFELKNVMKKKNLSAFFDEFGYALNIFIVPSIEEILRIVQLDMDSNQTIEYEEIFYDIDEYRLEEQFCDIKEDSRIPLKKIIEKQRFSPSRKLNRLYQRKKHFLNKGFEYLEKTSLFIMMNILFSLKNVLFLEFFMSLLESHPHDIFYLKMGFLDSERLIIENNDKIPDLKKNELRIRNDLDGVRFLSKKIQETIVMIKNNEKIINVNEAIMIYLQKIQKKKYNMILMLILNEINIVRKATDFNFLQQLSNFLINFAFPNLRALTRIDQELILNNYMHNLNENPYIPPLFEDISSFMKLTKSVFFENKQESDKKLNFLNVFEKMSSFHDILELGFIELSKSKRTELATHLSEIMTKTNEIINKKGFYELQNVYRFEKEFNRIIKLNIRYNILKEIVYMLMKKSLPFQIINLIKTDDFIEKNLQIFETRFPLNSTIKEENTDKFGIILHEERLKFRMEVLANDFEKILLEENIRFYRNYNKIVKLDMKSLGNFREIPVYKAKFQHKILQKFQFFLQNLLDNSSEIPTVNKGKALAISSIHLEKSLILLNKSLSVLIRDKFSKFLLDFIRKRSNQESIFVENELKSLNLCFELLNLRNMMDFKVEAKVSYKSYMLLYQLDYLNGLFLILKDEAALKEEQIKEAMTHDYGKSLSDYEIQLEQFKIRYALYKDGMNLDLRNYIDNSKESNLKILKKKVFELKGGVESLTLNTKEIETKSSINYQQKKITILYVFEIFKRFRTFHQVRDVLSKEKFEKDLLKLNEKVISNETFMHKIRDLEIKEKGLEEELEENVKKIAFLKKQNVILTKDLLASFHDKKKLVKENSLQTDKISQCFTTLEDYKKKKTIEKTKGKLNFDEEFINKESILRRKFENENKELKIDKIQEKQEGNVDEIVIKRRAMTAKKDNRVQLKVNIEELPSIIRKRK